MSSQAQTGGSPAWSRVVAMPEVGRMSDVPERDVAKVAVAAGVDHPVRFDHDGRRAPRSLRLSPTARRPDVVVRAAGRAPLRREMGKLVFSRCATAAAALFVLARSSVTTRSRRSPTSTSATGSGVEGRVEDEGRRAVDQGRECGPFREVAAPKLPDKWHGLTDVETRYRQRYVDLTA